MLTAIVVLYIIFIISCTATDVDYSNSSLTTIPSIDANCTHLNLSFNMLQSIPGDSLNHLTNLIELDLSNNPIDSIETDFLKSNDQLHTLLCDSCFDCSCFQTDFESWLNWAVSTLNTTNLSCRDGRNIKDISTQACSASTSVTSTKSTLSSSNTASTKSTSSSSNTASTKSTSSTSSTVTNSQQTTPTGSSSSSSATENTAGARNKAAVSHEDETTAGIIFVVFEVLAAIAASAITVACIIMVKKQPAEDTTNLTANAPTNPGDGRNIEERIEEERPEAVEMSPLGNRDEEIGEPSHNSDPMPETSVSSNKKVEPTGKEQTTSV